jgi:alkylation response protein AidB-like acyl-CoA dehydrogenase
MSEIKDVGLEKVLDVAEANAAAVDRESRFPSEAVTALTESRLLGLTLPEEAGGIGGTPSDFLQVITELASRCASSAMVYLMHVASAQVALAGGAPAESMRAIATTSLSTLAFSEKGSRSHFWAPVSIPVDDGGGLRLSAHKSFVTSAGHAGHYVVATRQAEAESPLASSLYLVGASASGLTVGEPWSGLGLRGNASAPMTFETPLAECQLLGEDGKGLDLMLGVVLPWFQLGQGGVSTGIAQGAMRAAVAHVTGARFEHLDQTLADLPTVRARIGRAQTEIEAVDGFLQQLAMRMAESDPAAPVLSAKAVGNELAIRVTAQLMQAAGGAAMSSQLPIERFFRDARAGSVMAPTTDVLYELTGRSLVGLPLLEGA